MKFVCSLDRPHGQVEVNEANSEGFMASETGYLEGCLTIFSLEMPTAFNIEREMMLIEDLRSSMALLSSTLFTSAVM